MEFSNSGLDPGSQEEYWKVKINDALFWTLRAPNKGGKIERVGVFKEKKNFVLNDILGHFKQF